MADSLSTLDDFNGVDGQFPDASLITDKSGNLFGTTGRGGSNGDGTVFEITYSPTTGYASTPLVLASFNGTNGSALEGNLLADAEGDLFGTTEQGGANGGGTVFEIVKTADGYASVPTVLVSFGRSAEPRSGLISDANGDLFGVTNQDGDYFGGTYGGGTVFEIAKTATGYATTPTVLATFTPLAGGYFPIGGLIADKAGDLFGTTDGGGPSGYGTLFEIVKTASGYAKTPTVLVNFDANTAGQFGGLVFDANGNLFGVSGGGGAYAGGAVYEVAKTATGYASTPTILASFNGPIAHSGPELNTDGSYPTGTLIIDAQGNLFGTTQYGGMIGDGTVFEIAKTASGYATTPTMLHSFSGGDGSIPAGGLAVGADGGLVGTTLLGGSNNAGTVYEVTLPPPAPVPEIFSQVQAATGGPLDGAFVWSNAANWTDGVPFDNDSAIIEGKGFDDIADLTLFELSLAAGDSVSAVQNLTVDTVVADASSAVFASTTPRGSAASVTLSIGAFAGTGGEFGATGAGAVLDDKATSSPAAALYTASAGGAIAVANDLMIGGDTAGALEVESGGKVTSVNGKVGNGAGTGRVTVDGSGSSWSMSGALTIGAQDGTSSPSMTISDGASVTTSSSLTSEDVLLDGSLTLSSKGQLTETELSMLNAATLTVESGAVLNETVPSPTLSYVGLVGNGQMVLNGGTLNSPNEFTQIGEKRGVVAGNGTMTVSNGATGTNLATYLGNHSGDTGTLLLSGSGTDWTDIYGSDVDNNDAGIDVGVSGTGHLSITAGAVLSNPLAYIKVAQFDGSVGTVVVSDSGSELTAGGLLRVADRGNGHMTVENDATVTAGQVQVGDYNQSIGVLDIDSGASLTTVSASTIDVGPQAVAGGTIAVAAGSFELGVQAGSAGYVDVNDGTLTVEGDLVIGAGGAGAMSIENGGLVSAVNVTVGVPGSLSLVTGGTLNARSFTCDGSLAMQGGVLDPPTEITVDASGDISGFGTVEGSIDDRGRVTASGGTLDITGDVSGSGALTFTAPASLELNGTITNAGGITFSGSGESLILGAQADIKTAISGLGDGDAVALDGKTIVSAVYTAGTGQLAIAGSDGSIFDLTLLGTHQQSDFTVADGKVQVSSPSVGTGPDQLALKLSEDAYQGDATYTVSVDGQQIGGIQTATAAHGSATDELLVNGTWGAGPHTFTVDFLNDLYGGSASADRNLYVDSATYNGATVTGAQVALYQDGPVSLEFNQTPSTTPTSIGSGPDQLALKLSEDAYQGDAQYTVSVDGQQIGGPQTAFAPHDQASDTLLVDGNWGAGPHNFTVDFLNDLYGGSASMDRNLYLDSATYNGATVSGAQAALYQDGPASLEFNQAPSATPTSIGFGPDQLALDLSEDAYQGDAQYTVSVDGKQIGGPQTAFAAHGKASDTLLVDGSWAPGAHTFTVDFLNDRYGGSASTDRNLYLDGATYDGAAVSGATAALYSNGSKSFVFHEASG